MTNEFTSIGLIKKWWKTLFGNEPLLSQVREKYENGLIIWWALMSVCYPLWTHKNEKRNSPFKVGKLKERGMVFICLYGSTLQSTFEHGTCLHLHIWTVQVFSLSSSRSIFVSHLTPLIQFKECFVIFLALHPVLFLFKSKIPSHVSCHQIVQRMSLPKS